MGVEGVGGCREGEREDGCGFFYLILFYFNRINYYFNIFFNRKWARLKPSQHLTDELTDN